MKRIILTSILTLVLITNSTPAHSVDFQDSRTPVIQSLTQQSKVVFEQGEYFLEMTFELKVKTFKNPLSGVKFFYMREYNSNLRGCQLLPTEWGPLTLLYGQDFNTKLDSMTTPNGLVSSQNYDGYKIETHSFSFSTRSLRSSLNTRFSFCDHRIDLDYIHLYTVAGYRNSISLNSRYFFSELFNEFPSARYQNYEVENPNVRVDNNFCPQQIYKISRQTVTARQICDHQINLQSLSVSLSPIISELAKAESEAKVKAAADAKAAADLRAKQEAEAKAAAELKAKQEADAKTATEKAALGKAQSELAAANAALADAQKVNREQAARISSLEMQLKAVSESVTALQTQLSQLNSKLVAALAGQNAVNVKLKKVCSVKPKPKGC
jgi:hypothetical protein